MSKQFRPGKGLAIWALLSAAIIIAGAVVLGIFGFNTKAQTRTVEVGYDAIVEIGGKEEDLQKLCEEAFSSAKVSAQDSYVTPELDPSYAGETGDKILVYVFSGDADAAALKNAAQAIESAANARFTGAEVTADVHSYEAKGFYEASWRGAVALFVAAVVALVYVGFRFGVASALTGLIACVHDGLLAVALLALVRIPVYAYTPVLFAGIAVVMSLILWIVQSAKMRENFKDPSYASLSAEEAVCESCMTSYKYVLGFALPAAAVLAVLGAVATSGMRLFMLPALIPVAVSVYSSLLFAPAIHVLFKGRIDKIASKQKRYAGKKKAESAESED